MKKNILSFAAGLLAILPSVSSCTGAGDALFVNGRTRYTIVVSPEASTSEKTAAKELKDYLGQISGADFQLTEDLSFRGRKIVVGYNGCTADAFGEMSIDNNDESFTYRSKGRDIYIYGGRQRGTMYGVFAFLENELGCRWYTPDCTKVPQMDAWSFRKLDHQESPALKYRYSNYFLVADAPAWSAHNKENAKGVAKENEYGNIEAYWGAHTMGQFVSEKEFFDSHPEYFAMRDGKREKGGQLCLSNPEVLEICKERLLKKMDDEPLNRIYSLSQNDNTEFCECEECRKLEEQYGGHSGLILWFVNQVAEAAKVSHPDKYVGTFAYWYSRKPPVGIAPLDNVVIRLCNVECCFAHPLEAGCPQNEEFIKDLDSWKEIAPHLFIWDYIVNYSNYLMPWPNFAVLAPNIRTFRDHNAIGIFEEAQYQSPCSEFDGLKTWVITKLLWDPEQDTEALVKDFIDGYYGKAAPKILEYYHLCQSCVKPDTHFGIFTKEDHPVYTDEFVKEGEAVLEEAAALAEDETIRERIDKVKLQITYLKFKRNKYVHCYPDAMTDGTWAELKEKMIKYNARADEWSTLENFIKKVESE